MNMELGRLRSSSPTVVELGVKMAGFAILNLVPHVGGVEAFW